MRLCAALAVAALIGALPACRWREDRYVWVEIFDASPDGTPDGDTCGSDEAHPISAAELRSLVEAATADLVVVDIRSESLCRSVRIPGAQCVPYADGAFAGDIEGLDGARDVVLYAQSLDPHVIEAAETLDLTCEQTLSVLEDGLQGWTEWGYGTESDD